MSVDERLRDDCLVAMSRIPNDVEWPSWLVDVAIGDGHEWMS